MTFTVKWLRHLFIYKTDMLKCHQVYVKSCMSERGLSLFTLNATRVLVFLLIFKFMDYYSNCPSWIIFHVYPTNTAFLHFLKTAHFALHLPGRMPRLVVDTSDWGPWWLRCQWRWPLQEVLPWRGGDSCRGGRPPPLPGLQGWREQSQTVGQAEREGQHEFRDQ